MRIDKLSPNENLGEQENLSVFDHMFFFPEVDADIEAIAFVPIEEVEAQLSSRGLDPHAPFPIRLTRMLSEQGTQIGSETGACSLNAFKENSAITMFSRLGAYVRAARPSLATTFCHLLMLLVIFQVICFVRYLSLDHEVQRVRILVRGASATPGEELTTGNNSDLGQTGSLHLSPEPSGSSSGNSNSSYEKASKSRKRKGGDRFC